MFRFLRSLHGAVRVGCRLAAGACLLAAGIRPVFAQAASLAGRILLDSKDTPLANAEVVVPKLNLSARSDSTGSFILGGIPAGKHEVLIRLIGHESITTDVTFKPSEKVEADLWLKPTITTLKGVDVTATATKGPWAIRLAEFDERRATGIGRFLTADYFESQNGRPASSLLLEKIPGLRIVQSGGRAFMASTRGCGMGGCADLPRDPSRRSCVDPRITGSLDCVNIGQCYMQVVVNGVTRYDGSTQMFDIDGLNSKDIIGLEFFTVSTTPLQYNRTSPATRCGTVVIWTKGG